MELEDSGYKDWLEWAVEDPSGFQQWINALLTKFCRGHKLTDYEKAQVKVIWNTIREYRLRN